MESKDSFEALQRFRIIFHKMCARETCVRVLGDSLNTQTVEHYPLTTETEFFCMECLENTGFKCDRIFF